MNNLGLNQKEIEYYYHDSIKMIQNWFDQFIDKISQEIKSQGFEKSFQNHTPLTEVKYVSNLFGVMGYIDAIFHEDNEAVLIDYKTSKNDQISDEYWFQLGIYALLYFEKHKKMPKEVGINFLKFNEKRIKITKEELRNIVKEIEKIHKNTKSKEISDYEKNITPLCKWSSGQCEFYDVCSKE